MLPHPSPRKLWLVSALFAALLSGCSSGPKREAVLIPPRMDLSRYGTLGLVDFVAPAEEDLGARASREFLAALQSAQPGTPVLELGSQERLLAQLGRGSLDAEAARLIGEKYRVDALIVGSLDSQRVSPKVAFDSMATWMSASAELQGALDVRILVTKNGATVWSAASRAKTEIAGVQVSDRGVSTTGSGSPDDARQRLVNRLVRSATQDFWSHWE